MLVKALASIGQAVIVSLLFSISVFPLSLPHTQELQSSMLRVIRAMRCDLSIVVVGTG